MSAPRLILSFALVALLVNPIGTALASSSAQRSVTASAVVVPVQVTELGFLLPALVKEVNVKVGEQVQAGRTLAVLDTPELQYAVAAAEAALRSAEANEKVQSYRRVKDRRHGRVFF